MDTLFGAGKYALVTIETQPSRRRTQTITGHAKDYSHLSGDKLISANMACQTIVDMVREVRVIEVDLNPHIRSCKTVPYKVCKNGS